MKRTTPWEVVKRHIHGHPLLHTRPPPRAQIHQEIRVSVLCPEVCAVTLHQTGGTWSLDAVQSTPVSGKRNLRNQYPPAMPILHSEEVLDYMLLTCVVLPWQATHPILPWQLPLPKITNVFYLKLVGRLDCAYPGEATLTALSFSLDSRIDWLSEMHETMLKWS